MNRCANRLSAVRRVRAWLALAALSAWLCPAAQALVLGQCTVSASDVAFATYTPLTTASSTGTITIKCGGVIGSSSATVDLSAGASLTVAARTMSNGTSTLSYNLYTTAADNVIWGDGSAGYPGQTLTINGLGNVTVTATVYGSVPAQDPAPGAYTDSITVTVSY